VLVLDSGAQAGVQTASCGDAALSQQENNTRQQMSGDTFLRYQHVWSAPLYQKMRTFLIVVPRPVPRPVPDRCLRRRGAVAEGKEHSATDEW
jgi:hypothetical protein